MAEMKNAAQPFEACFVGLMTNGCQPRLVEYNVRFGDPECQCLMMRLGATLSAAGLCRTQAVDMKSSAQITHR
jgi:phosphoribosylamine--glycine ligase